MGVLGERKKRSKLTLPELLHKVQSSIFARAKSESLFDQLLDRHFQVALGNRLFREQLFSKEHIPNFFQYAQYYSRRKMPHLAVRYFLIYCHGCWIYPSLTQESFSLLISIFSLGVNLKNRTDCLRVHQEVMSVALLMDSSREKKEILVPFYLQKWRRILMRGQLNAEHVEVLKELLSLSPEHEALSQDWRSIHRNGKILYSLDSSPCSLTPFTEKSHVRKVDEPYCKSIFDSGLEQRVYEILVERMPECLILPNHPVANLFVYEQMRELLSPLEFQYFHKSRVDFCMVSRQTFKPVLAVELDGPDHGLIRIQAKDELKREIFRLGGLPLIRLDCSGQKHPQSIAEDILEHFYSRITRTSD